METISGTRNTLLSFGPLSTKGQHSNQIPRGSNLDHPSVQGESGRVRDKPGTREKCDRGQEKGQRSPFLGKFHTEVFRL